MMIQVETITAQHCLEDGSILQDKGYILSYISYILYETNVVFSLQYWEGFGN